MKTGYITAHPRGGGQGPNNPRVPSACLGHQWLHQAGRPSNGAFPEFHIGPLGSTPHVALAPALSGAGQGLERSQRAAKNRPLKVWENLDPWFMRTGRQACRNEAVYPILSILKGAPVPTISKSKI